MTLGPTVSRRNPAALAAAALAASLLFLAAFCALPEWNRRGREIDDLRRSLAALQRRLDLDDAATGTEEPPSHHQPHTRASALSSVDLRGDGGGRGARSLQAAGCDRPSSFTYASDFNVVGDTVTDDAPALQAAIDSAASDAGDGGGTVILPRGTFLTKSPLIIPGGVTLRGQGYGSSPLAIQFDAGASTIAYCGTDYAVKLSGHGAGLHDLAVYDWRYSDECDAIKAAGGVLVDADGHGVESVRVSNILLYWFMGGTSLELKARNEGLIAFGSFNDILIRHAHTAVRMSADETSVCNSNSFNGGAIWGGITEVAVLAEGPGACNDNKFMGTAIEPSATLLAHVYVTGSKTNLKLLHVRMEGTEMDDVDKPLIIIDDSSYGNVMNGVFGHTNVQADLSRNPGIDFVTSKTVGVDPAPRNLYWNAGFHGYDAAARSLPGWSLVGSNADLTILPDSEETHAGHKVLGVDYLNYGGAFKLMADTTPKSPGHSFATFGVYARTTVKGAIVAAMRYESGSIISSSPHSGSGKWEFIAMSALYDQSAPYFYFSITGDVDLTAPVFTYGNAPATPGASLLSSDGARMAGTFSLGLASLPVPPSSTPYYWKLPKNGGNLFKVETDGDPIRTIIRLNHSTADRFDRGSVVTLLFAEEGTRVQNNAYISLKGGQDFVSTVHSSITLLSEGGPTWTEVTRNE